MAEGWKACVEALEREERTRWGGLPAAGALYGTAGFRDKYVAYQYTRNMGSG